MPYSFRYNHANANVLETKKYLISYQTCWETAKSKKIAKKTFISLIELLRLGFDPLNKKVTQAKDSDFIQCKLWLNDTKITQRRNSLSKMSRKTSFKRSTWAFWRWRHYGMAIVCWLFQRSYTRSNFLSEDHYRYFIIRWLMWKLHKLY